MAPFFEGINYRIDARPSSILGWVFSYGWNDTCRFVSSGLPNSDGMTLRDAEDVAQPGCETRGDTDVEMGTDVPAADTETAGSTTKPQSTLHIKPGISVNCDFRPEQWRIIGLGWRDFQNDLRHAARMGVHVWRMKVGVLALP